jgi:hypothetical protein
MSDPRQRTARRELNEALLAALDGRQKHIWTMLPGVLVSSGQFPAWNPADNTCTVQPTIQGRFRSSPTSQSWTWKNMPLLIKCPVVFPRGGGWTLTFPLKAGVEGCVHFSSRCVDAWWLSGGVQQQMEFRMHDLSDGFFQPGPMSVPNVIKNISETTAQWRSDDGTQYIELAPEGKINGVAPGGFDLNGVIIDKNGNVTAPGDITAGFGTSDSVTLQDHLHSNAGGSGNSGKPVAGT